MRLQVAEKEVVNVANYNQQRRSTADSAMMDTDPPAIDSARDLRIPTVTSQGRNHEARCKREYNQNTHLYFIHSVSVCPDEATFMTSDDLTIFLWDLERADSAMRTIDIRPAVPDESEVRLPLFW